MIFVLDIIDINDIKNIYEDPLIEESIRLKSEDYKPAPPSDSSDWCRTALLAVEDGGQGLRLCFYWWRYEDDMESCIIHISGGTVDIYDDLMELIANLALGTTPERGMFIYEDLEKERGTLRD